MNKQQSVQEIAVGLTPRKLIDFSKHSHLGSWFLRATAAMLIGLSLVLTTTASAHNIDLEKARDEARTYARAKRDDPNRNYKHYTTDCVEAFPGHNHYVRCTIFYQNEAGKQSCTERIEVFLQPHVKRPLDPLQPTYHQNPEMFIKHTSPREC